MYIIISINSPSNRSRPVYFLHLRGGHSWGSFPRKKCVGGGGEGAQLGYKKYLVRLTASAEGKKSWRCGVGGGGGGRGGIFEHAPSNVLKNEGHCDFDFCFLSSYICCICSEYLNMGRMRTCGPDKSSKNDVIFFLSENVCGRNIRYSVPPHCQTCVCVCVGGGGGGHVPPVPHQMTSMWSFTFLFLPSSVADVS